MAHMILKDSRLVVAREAAWHKLGTVLKDCFDQNTAYQLGGFFEMEKLPLRDPWGKEVPYWGIFNASSGEFIGAVGADYTVVSPRVGLDVLDALMEAENGGHYVSAGVIGKGEQMFASVEIPGLEMDTKTGKWQTTLTMLKGNDGSKPVIIKLTNLRVVCKNTFDMALAGNGASFRIKHTAKAEERIELAKKLIAKSGVTLKALEEKLNILASRKMTRESAEAAFERLFPVPKDANKSDTRRKNSISDILSLYDWNDNNAIPEIRGTAANLFNAAVEWTDHARGVRLSDEKRKMGYDEDRQRAESAVLGSGDAFKQDALSVLLEVTANNPSANGKSYYVTQTQTQTVGNDPLSDLSNLVQFN